MPLETNHKEGEEKLQRFSESSAVVVDVGLDSHRMFNSIKIELQREI